MARQIKQNFGGYDSVFATTLRVLLMTESKDGHTTTYKALGEAVGVRQQTISQYASGQSQPTGDVLLKIANYFNVSVDYLLTGVSAKNKGYNEELGLSEESIELLKRAKDMYPQTDFTKTQTMPYLDELLSDKDFYEFLDEMHYYIEGLNTTKKMDEGMKAQFNGLNIEGYFIWELQMYVQEFIQKEINKLGLNITTE